MRFFILIALSLGLLYAEPETSLATDSSQAPSQSLQSSDTNQTQWSEEDLYLSYESLPKRVYQHQIFSVTIKILNTNRELNELWRAFSAMQGLKLISKEPQVRQEGYTRYETYYFQALASRFRLPDFFYKLVRSNIDQYQPKKLSGRYFNAISLHYDNEFSHLLAQEFEITGYKTTHYDNTHNIIVFSAQTTMGNVEDFNLSIAVNQGFESYVYELPQVRMTYFAVIPKYLQQLSFNYFDINHSRYITKSIPIEVNDDSVSTQMDLAPTQYTHTFAKIIIASLLALLGLILYIIKRQKRYFFIIALAPILYLIWVYFPKEKLCIKPDAKVHLLPMTHATIFKKSSITEHLQKLGKVGEYNKVLLQNGNIGWIKDEDICED